MTEKQPDIERQRAHRPTLYLMVGLPGSGKTTRARAIETADAALRLTPDDWLLALYGPDLGRSERDAVRGSIEALQWAVAQRALTLGCNVVLDWGFWLRAEREQYRARAEALGARVRLVFLDADTAALWSRITARAESIRGTLAISRAELDAWAARFEPPSADEFD